jgi:hypothetical protein
MFADSTHCTENSKQILSEMKLHGLVPNFCIHVSVRSQIHECRNWERGCTVHGAVQNICTAHKNTVLGIFCSYCVWRISNITRGIFAFHLYMKM